MTIDLTPSAHRIADLVSALPLDLLGAPTPCPAYSVGDLVEHIGGLAVAFAGAAKKAGGPTASQAARGDAARLAPDWRSRIPNDLLGMAAAWRDPAAWTGMTRVGGVDLAGEIAGLVALDEIFLHGWDLAVASGQHFGYDEAGIEAVHGFVLQSAAPEQRTMRDRIFGPVIQIPPAAPLLDRVLGLAGRDPGWSAG